MPSLVLLKTKVKELLTQLVASDPEGTETSLPVISPESSIEFPEIQLPKICKLDVLENKTEVAGEVRTGCGGTDVSRTQRKETGDEKFPDPSVCMISKSKEPCVACAIVKSKLPEDEHCVEEEEAPLRATRAPISQEPMSVKLDSLDV